MTQTPATDYLHTVVQEVCDDRMDRDSLAPDTIECLHIMTRELTEGTSQALEVVRQHSSPGLVRELQKSLADACDDDNLIGARVLYMALGDDRVNLCRVWKRAGMTRVTRQLIRWIQREEAWRAFWKKCLTHRCGFPLLQDMWEEIEHWSVYYDASDVWCDACRYGNLKTVKWIYKAIYGTDHFYWETDSCPGFEAACQNNIQIARWVYGQGDLANGYGGSGVILQPFRNACHLSLEAAQWVYSLERFADRHYRDIDNHLWSSCLETPSRYPTAAWLLTIPSSIQGGHVRASLITAAGEGQHSVVQFLCGGPLDGETELYDQALEACMNSYEHRPSPDLERVAVVLVLALVRAGADLSASDRLQERCPDLWASVGRHLPRRPKSARSTVVSD